MSSWTKLDEPPHRYKSADAFLPLIQNISGIQNLTTRSAAATCNWTDEELLQYPYGRLEDYIANPPSGHEVELMRSSWQAFVKESLLPYPRGEFLHQRPVGTHNFYFSKTPYNDISRVNFQLKTAALLNSRFAEPLLLDSDNVPAPGAEPAALWDSAAYREFGTVFWPDVQRAHRENPVYAATNTRCRRDEYELESGQLLVDKRRFWYHLQLTDWFLAQPRLFGRYLLGDKDTFRFAWGALRTRYGRPRRWVTLVGTMLPRPRSETDRRPVEAFCGHSFAQHHPDTGEVAFVHGGALKSYGAPLLQRLQIKDKDKGKDKNSIWSITSGRVWMRTGARLSTPANQTEAPIYCIDFENQPARDVEEILPGFAAAFEQAGGLWMIGDKYRAGISGA
ncbi:glycosyltransferase family 71 protein [Apiospora phragmitis]|uniref:Glycosyltransferase family 71 protein n=1 Tax=Apiospora phragmitis TaxID=2905665 RepID=A0ABR1TVC6_9PEZI